MFVGHALLVEDSEIIALDTEDMLIELGFASVAIARSCREATEAIEHRPPVVAVLDINLDNETSFPIAERLAKANIPIVFATGYGAHANVPEAFADRPIVSKPYTRESLRRAIERAAMGEEARPESA